jgi:hypothetical protein
VFCFQQLLMTAIGGIDSTSIIATVSNIAFAILLVGFLIGLYQAALHGGDLQALAVTAIKYLVVAMIVANWAAVFRDLNESFSAVANFIGSSSGAGDMFLNWMTQLQEQATNNPGFTFWDLINGDAAGTITVLLLLVAYMLYALAIIIFCFFYVLYGAVLYVVGPLVLALIPIPGVGQMGRAYSVNLMIWNAWGVLYAVFGALITAIHFNRVNDVLGSGFLGFLRGVPDTVMLGLVSIFYALAIALVPFIAHKIVSGDVGSSAYSFVRAGAIAVGAALAGAAGFASGAGAATAGGLGTLGAGSTGTSAGATSWMPPPTPATSMASFLRSGIAGATNSGTAAVPPPSSSKDNPAGKTSRPAAAAAGAPLGYRPHSVTQTITFNVARALGKAAGRKNADNS